MIFFQQQLFTLFDLKDFISYKYICKIYILADIEEIVENQDLYRKTTYEKKLKIENIFNFLSKRFYIL